MISKLVTHGNDRPNALRRMAGWDAWAGAGSGRGRQRIALPSHHRALGSCSPCVPSVQLRRSWLAVPVAFPLLQALTPHLLPPRPPGRRALDRYVIRGVQHNAPLLRTVLDAPDFRAGNVSTDFLARHYPTPASSAPHALPLSWQQEGDVAALAAVMHLERELRLRTEQGGLLKVPPLLLL